MTTEMAWTLTAQPRVQRVIYLNSVRPALYLLTFSESKAWDFYRGRATCGIFDPAVSNESEDFRRRKISWSQA